jgi:hypothetical protein
MNKDPFSSTCCPETRTNILKQPMKQKQKETNRRPVNNRESNNDREFMQAFAKALHYYLAIAFTDKYW